MLNYSYSRFFYQIFLLLCAVVFATVAAGGTEPKAMPLAGIENVWQLDESLLSGGEPGQATGLEQLKARGIKTVISVDGAPPPVAQAKRLGLRYVHIPIGYDGIPPEKQLLLAQAFTQMPKPIYIHCHHGRHRGPAAAVIMARFGLGWSANQATQFMQNAGTATDYTGLYDAARTFQMLDKKAVAGLNKPLPETVDVSSMVEMMVQIDSRMDNLKAWASRMLEPKPNSAGKQPTINPVQEAVQLRELVRESARLPEGRDQPAAFAGHFKNLETDLTRWIDSLKAQPSLGNLQPAAQKNLTTILKSAAGHCVSCHRSYRDQKKPAERKIP